MATVRLGFSPAPAHVRTARLVAVAVARRAGVAEGLLDEVRLAVGEACSRAVALHLRHGCTDLVEVEMDDAAVVTPGRSARVAAGNRTAARTGLGDVRGAAPSGGAVVEATHATDTGPRFVVRVVDRTPADIRPGEPMADPVSLVGADLNAETGGPQARMEATQFAEEAVAANVGLALLAGLVDDLEVTSTPDGTGTVVSMSWPIEPSQ